MRNLWLVMVGVFLWASAVMPAYAQTPPRPDSKTKALAGLQEEIEREKARQDALAQSAAQATRELESTKKDIIRFADKIRKSEFALTSLEERISSLTKEEKALTSSLEKDYGSIAELILALERIRRVPPETLIMRPGAPLETAQSALLLSGVLPVVKERTDKLSADLERLDTIHTGLAKDRKAALADRKKLDADYKDMQALLKQRERLYEATQQDVFDNKSRIATLSREAGNLQDLLVKLEQERKKQIEEERKRTQRQAATQTKLPARPKYVDVTVPAAGQPRLPVTGLISMTYGQQDEIGAKSEGVRVDARPNAIVVAPMGGVVRYVGYFKNYGNIVIIEHKGGYHSLIGGFETIETALLRQVQSGEPVGKLPSRSSYGANPSLYYELRYNGRSVDPSVKFSELKS